VSAHNVTIEIENIFLLASPKDVENYHRKFFATSFFLFY